MKNWKKVMMIGMLSVIPICLYAQVVYDDSTGVDKLKFSERVSLHTNGLDWLILTPNIGVELDLGNKNWNRYTVGASFRIGGNKIISNDTNNPWMNFGTIGGKVYVRNYWRTHDLDEQKAFFKHKTLTGKLFSQRRDGGPKHIKTTYYKGLFVSYDNYDLKLSDSGHKGQMWMAGLDYGIIRPLYIYSNGNSLDIDLGISVGVCMRKYDKYTLNEQRDYVVTKQHDWSVVPAPMVQELRLGLVYRFGKYPILKKYRRRLDADTEFLHKVSQERQAREEARNRKYADELKRYEEKHSEDRKKIDNKRDQLLNKQQNKR